MSLLTTLMGLVKPQDNDNSRAHFVTIGAGYHANMDKLDSHTHDNDAAGAAVKRVASGLDAGKPAAGNAGRVYVATDTGLMYVDTGTTWIALNLHGAGTITDAMLVSLAGGKVVGAVATATNATYAVTADYATGAGHAIIANDADNAANAANATHANDAYTADYATGAGHAVTANDADNATHATSADGATYANTANSANTATNATHATSADSATNATHATSADSADGATYANTANSANTATNATHATSADSADGATHATYAETAGAATTANNATNATNANTLSHVSSCRVWHDTDQPVISGTIISLDFNAERYDTDSIHSLTSAISCLSCQTAGIYLISGAVLLTFGTTGTCYIELLLNGSSIIAHQDGIVPNLHPSGTIRLNTIYSLAVNDYVQLRVQQSGSSDPCHVVSQAYISPEFSMVRLGPAY